jgi:hypothetical protein
VTAVRGQQNQTTPRRVRGSTHGPGTCPHSSQPAAPANVVRCCGNPGQTQSATEWGMQGALSTRSHIRRATGAAAVPCHADQTLQQPPCAANSRPPLAPWRCCSPPCARNSTPPLAPWRCCPVAHGGTLHGPPCQRSRTLHTYPRHPEHTPQTKDTPIEKLQRCSRQQQMLKSGSVIQVMRARNQRVQPLYATGTQVNTGKHDPSSICCACICCSSRLCQHWQRAVRLDPAKPATQCCKGRSRVLVEPTLDQPQQQGNDHGNPSHGVRTASAP